MYDDMLYVVCMYVWIVQSVKRVADTADDDGEGEGEKRKRKRRSGQQQQQQGSREKVSSHRDGNFFSVRSVVDDGGGEGW